MLIGALPPIELPLGARLLDYLGLDLDELLDAASLDAVIDFDFIGASLAQLRLQHVWSTGGVKMFT